MAVAVPMLGAERPQGGSTSLSSLSSIPTACRSMTAMRGFWVVALLSLSFAVFLSWDFWFNRTPGPSAIPREANDEPFHISSKDVIFEVGDGTQIDIIPKLGTKKSTQVSIVLDDKSLVETLGSFTLPANSSSPIRIPIYSRDIAGHCVMSFRTSSKDPKLENLFKTRIHIKVVHQIVFGYLSIIIGWLYFVMWSCCYYPQIFKNFRRRSVLGFSFDYLVLNFTGHICYFVFNLSMAFNTSIQKQFTLLHPKGELPVKMNDVFFSCHAILMNIVILTQCLTLERGEQKVSFPMAVLVGGLWVTILSCLAGAIMERISWMQFVYYLAYIKVGTTPIKYTPQVYMNYINKSTEGWAIHGVWLDAAGGVLSFTQMAIDAINNDDIDGELGNPGKLGLSIIAIFYCGIFVVQHYFLYKPSASRKRKDTTDAVLSKNSESEHEHFNEKLKQLKQSLVHTPNRDSQIVQV